MKLEKPKPNNCTPAENPKKEDAILDERLILKMDEEAPQHVFPEQKASSNKKSVTDNIKKK